MKKNLFFLLFMVLSFFSKPLISQGLLGGEIRWDCIPAVQANGGSFVFYLKIYQACYNDTATNPILSNTQLFETTSPAGNTIMNLLAGYPKDLSPICNQDTSFSHTGCGTADSISAFNGAYRVYIYADTLMLNATPPAYGWTFSWNGGKRNRSSNLVNSLNPTMRLRSLMYSYGNQSAYPCFDAAPESAEEPVVMTCNAYSFNYFPFTQDLELDSLYYNWENPEDSSGNNVSFDANHSYISPLPNTLDNPNNINAMLNSYSGWLNLTSYSSGGYFACQKISAYKCGVLVADIYRDMYFQFFDCDSNVSPTLQVPFSNGDFVDTFYTGEYIQFNLEFTDSQYLANSNPQNVNMIAYGSEFGSYIPSNGSNPPIFDTMQGCLNPPCASLKAAPSDSLPLIATTSLSTQFSWQTVCDHFSTNIGCGQTSNIFNFYFKFWDDYCPVPAYNFGRVKIVILPSLLPAPQFDSLVLDTTNGDVHLYWQPIIDSLAIFSHYSIFSSVNKNGPYTLIDSLSNINDSTYLHQGANALIQDVYYYLRTDFYCGTPFQNESDPSDTLYTLYTSTSIDNTLFETSLFKLLPSIPNPASEMTQLRFQFSENGRVKLRVFDVSGRVLMHRNIEAKRGDNNYTIDVSNFENGVYFYQLTYQNLHLRSKFIVLQ